jgi:hypothetical protein
MPVAGRHLRRPALSHRHNPQVGIMLLASLDRLIEHCPDRRGQRPRPVDHRLDRPGDVRPAVAQAGDQGLVLRRALGQRQRVLGSVDADAEAINWYLRG